MTLYRPWYKLMIQHGFLVCLFFLQHSVHLLKHDRLHSMPLVLYEEDINQLSPNNATWTRYVIVLPTGSYQIIFSFTMGYPSESDAAIDEVKIVPCAKERNLTHGRIPEGRLGSHWLFFARCCQIMYLINGPSFKVRKLVFSILIIQWNTKFRTSCLWKVLSVDLIIRPYPFIRLRIILSYFSFFMPSSKLSGWDTKCCCTDNYAQVCAKLLYPSTDPLL